MTPLPDPAHRTAEQAARASYGKLVALLAARNRDIAAAEDALSDALVAALETWPKRGVPANPEGWLMTTARNRQLNRLRAGFVRQRAEPDLILRLDQTSETGEGRASLPDDRLRLMFVCTHPAIDPSVRAPLILQTVLGFDAARIAQAFLAEPAAMSQRLVRAKARIRDAGLRFAVPGPEDLADRLADVLDAVYAAFGQGWDALDPPEAEGGLTGEAIWLARLLADLLPEEPEPRGLLALMLYCTARRDARRDATGGFVPLERQDPRLWDRNMVIEAEGLLTVAARAARFGRYQCEAAIQSVHVQRAVTGQLNNAALRTLYDLLVRHTDALGARLGRAVVIADAGDIPAAVAEIDALDTTRLRNHQPYWVARSHVETRAGMTAQAIASLQAAIALTTDPALRAHLAERLARLHSAPDDAPSQDPG
jgi:RNA polymerase sigma-70 factor, ECF subfamily